MTNRKWINNRNVYDLLIEMNFNIRKKSGNDFCILDCLNEYAWNCTGKCDICLQQYLIEEHGTYTTKKECGEYISDMKDFESKLERTHNE